MNVSSSDNAIESRDVSLQSCDYRETEDAAEPVTVRRWMRRWFWHLLVRQITWWCLVAMRVAGCIGRRRRPIRSEGCEIMLIGRFDSANWILAHLGPLAASKGCSCLQMVSTNPVPQLPKVVPIYPPEWLTRVVGEVLARSLTFAWLAVRARPDLVGGFHLSANGMVAAVVGRLAGARTMYFCVGGPTEVHDGGIHCDDNIFARMETVDAVVEKRLTQVVSSFDLVITMGTRAIGYLRDKGVHTEYHVVSGGIDPRRFRDGEEKRPVDVIVTGRLVPIKRIDVFLHAVRRVTEKLHDFQAVIVGSGTLRTKLEEMAVDLGVESNVSFAGYQDDVEDWLRKSKIFVLTSDSEGLSLSLMEAMMCGLPAVVSDVGDLGDLVESGVNGYLVRRRAPDLFAARIVELLSDERKLLAFSEAAHRAAMRYETRTTTRRWDHILADLS